MRKRKNDIPANAQRATPPVKKERAAGPKAYIVVDHPVEGEIVRSLSYTFRIGASAGGRVEVSFDDKEWLGCREDSGYWWFDWSNYGSGPRTFRARFIAQGRPPLKSKPRHFTVL